MSAEHNHDRGHAGNDNTAGAKTPEPFRQLVRDNAWTVVGTGRETFPPVSCSEFGSLKMPVLLVQGELTTAAFHQVVAEESRCLPQAKVVAALGQRGHCLTCLARSGPVEPSEQLLARLRIADAASRVAQDELSRKRVEKVGLVVVQHSVAAYFGMLTQPSLDAFEATAMGSSVDDALAQRAQQLPQLDDVMVFTPTTVHDDAHVGVLRE